VHIFTCILHPTGVEHKCKDSINCFSSSVCQAVLLNKPYFEAWFSHHRKPDVSHFHVFGISAYIHIPKKLRGKLATKNKLLLFVGYILAILNIFYHSGYILRPKWLGAFFIVLLIESPLVVTLFFVNVFVLLVFLNCLYRLILFLLPQFPLTLSVSDSIRSHCSFIVFVSSVFSVLHNCAATVSYYSSFGYPVHFI
jgi:hypothetical protein